MFSFGHGAAADESVPLESDINFDYYGYQNSKPKNRPVPGTTADGEIFASEVYADLSLAKRQPGKSLLKGRLIVSWLSLDFQEFAVVDSVPRFGNTIYTDLEGTYQRNFNDKWGGQARLTPGLAGDLTVGVGENDFTLGGGLWGIRHFENGSYLGAGATHTYDFGEPVFVFSIIGEYRTESIHIQGELPTFAEVGYALGESFDVGGVARVRGHRYALDPDEFVDLTKPFLVHSEPAVGLFVGWESDHRLYIRGDVGYAFSRRLRVLDDDTTVLNVDPENAWYVRVGMRLGRD